MVVYAATAVGVSFATSGLQCLIWATYAQEAILLITAAWACRRYISLKRLRWLPISEVRQILRFGSRVQIAAIASSFNYEVDALLVGFLFPVRYVAYYSIGANFSQQVTNMPINGLNPIVQDIGRSYGRSGKRGCSAVIPQYPAYVGHRSWNLPSGCRARRLVRHPRLARPRRSARSRHRGTIGDRRWSATAQLDSRCDGKGSRDA